MLALKTVLAAADGIPTLIFDEVDTGIGGKPPERWVLSSRFGQGEQVVCVTHLAQVAGVANHHQPFIRKSREVPPGL